MNTRKSFPLDYKIAFARLDSVHYVKDLEAYSRFVTPLMRKTQMSMSAVKDGIRFEVTPNSVFPNAQLDTSTMLRNPEALIGKWEMLAARIIEFKDSLDLDHNAYYRKASQLVDERKEDIAYATFSKKKFNLYLLNKNTNKYSKVEGAKYSIENNRTIFLYKIFKASGGISQVGIDENGYLIMNYAKVVTETNSKDKSHSYRTIITQRIFRPMK
jgi:hypothetical protein